MGCTVCKFCSKANELMLVPIIIIRNICARVIHSTSRKSFSSTYLLGYFYCRSTFVFVLCLSFWSRQKLFLPSRRILFLSHCTPLPPSLPLTLYKPMSDWTAGSMQRVERPFWSLMTRSLSPKLQWQRSISLVAWPLVVGNKMGVQGGPTAFTKARLIM